MEPQTSGGPPYLVIASILFKKVALLLSFRDMHLSFHDFILLILPFYPTWIYLILGKEGKYLFFLASIVSDITLVTNVEASLT